MGKVPDLYLEQHCLGERKLLLDEQLRQSVEALRQSNQQILDRYPAELIRRKIDERCRRKKLQRRELFLFSPLPIAALFLIVFSLFTGLSRSLSFVTPTLDPTGGGERIKGNLNSQTLQIYREGEEGITRLSNGDRVSASDRLQIGYRVNVKNGLYLTILSLDGNGVVTYHLPIQGDDAYHLDASSKPYSHLLDHSYILDDAPDYERFFLVSSESPFSVDRIVEKVRLLAQVDETEQTLVVGDEFIVNDILLRK